MRVTLACALLLGVALAGIPAASGATAVTVNIVQAISLGCSPDNWTSTDLRTTVYIDGKEVLRAYADQVDRPTYGATAQVYLSSGSHAVRVTVEEAEPGGLFSPDVFIGCDVEPGTARDYTTSWTGGTLRIDTSGDEADAARAIVVIGTDPPTKPQVDSSSIGSTNALVRWNNGGSAPQVALGHYGRILGSVDGNQVTLTGLCDNYDYRIRLLRTETPWTVSSTDLAFTTMNMAPQAPRIYEADRSSDRVFVRFEEMTPHDIASYTLHAGPDAANIREVAKSDLVSTWYGQSMSATVADTDTVVFVTAIDTRGAQTRSAAFTIDAPHGAGAKAGTQSCGITLGASSTGSELAATSSALPEGASSAAGETSSQAPAAEAGGVVRTSMPMWPFVVLGALALAGIGYAAFLFDRRLRGP